MQDASRYLHFFYIIILLEAPVKGWTQGRESDTPGVRTPTVVPCTSTVLPLYSPVLPLYSAVLPPEMLTG